ncbi:lantibiotic dehydratase [Streptomonospora salina]|uniref:Thiopeptide-type bacteriocin biosynthesis protein n=1 Tax=Streptomonospora salina TaxID=104205 RepID=A0A841EH74_9ACTN|nr:lantibiotic dehydratase [Streptomonospora salina]MBB6000178.1 thiopeptide-type bacteriocin biosynthesis protein [Streptomonospora salina]
MYAPPDPPAMTLRATALSAPAATPWPDPASATSHELRAWIHRCWTQDPGFAEALDAASPSLARQLDTLTRPGPAPRHAKVRRAAIALMRYLLRTQNRPTPYGLFAGVAPVAHGTETRAHWGSNHQAVARPDAAWLSAYARHHADPNPRDVLVAAHTAHVRGARLVRPWVPSQDDPRGAAAVSVRFTPVVARAMHAARTPASPAAVVDALAAEFPQAEASALAAVVDQLRTHGILISTRRPAIWVTDPLEAAAENAAPESPLPEACAVLAEHNYLRSDRRAQLRAAATSRLGRALPGHTARLAVDTRLDADVTLPPHVAREAGRAAQVLASLAPHATGTAAWTDYHVRCLDTYGPGATVDLLELVGPPGLGLPTGYRGSRLPESARTDGEREGALVTAAYTAALDGSYEIAVDEIPALAESAAHPPPHVEVRAQLHAASPSAVDAGDFDLRITGVSRSIGTLTGRFAHLDGMATPEVYRDLPTVTHGALPVQILAPPMADTAANVARAPVLAPHTLVIDEHPPPAGAGGTETIVPDDVAVHIEADHLRLLHRPSGRVIEPYLASALEPHRYTHPLARFCYELPRARMPAHLGFTWPTIASAFRFLPRLRSGRSILAPAQWRISASGHDGAGPRSDLPDRVVLLDGERYLSLDLTRAAHRYLLDDHLAHNTTAIVTEAPPAHAFGWCGDRAHEIVIPLHSTVPPTPEPPRLPKPADAGAPVPQPPGGADWVAAHLYTDADLFVPLLTEHLPQLWTLLGEVPDWWFVRYRDADGPHLRLRVRTGGRADAVTTAFGTWARSLHAHGALHEMTLSTYRPETGRYGCGPAMHAAEDVFVADSAAAVAQLELAAGDQSRTHAFAAASLIDLAIEAVGTTWLLDHLPRSGEPVDRSAHALADRTLTDLDRHPDQVPGELAKAWKERTDAFTSYLGDHSAPVQAARRVLPSLLHMHHNRIAGPDRPDERRLLALTRAVALSRHARQPRDRP